MAAALRALPLAGLAAATGLAGALLLVVLGSMYAPPVALAVAAAVAVGAILVVYMPWSVLLLMALVVPLERVGRFGDDLELQTFSVMRLVGVAALAAVFAQTLIRRHPIELPRPVVLYGLVVALAFASIAYADDVWATRSHAITMLGNLLMLWVVVQGVRDGGLARAMVTAWLVATLAVGLYQIYSWHFQPALEGEQLGLAIQRSATTYTDLSERSTLGETRRAIGTTSNPAVYGINLLLALPFVFWKLRVAPGVLWRTLWLIAAGIVIYNIMLTNTRAVFLFLALLLVLIVLTGLFRLTLYTLVGIAAAIAAVVVYLPASIWNRVLNLAAYDLSNATNLSWRFELWAAALRLGSENWLTGIGAGNRTAIIAYLDPTRFEAGWIMAHNDYLQTFYELGILGIGLFLAFLVVLQWRSVTVAARFRRLGDADSRWFTVAAGLSILIGILFALQVDSFHFPLKGWWLAAGLVLVLERLAAAAEARART